MARRAARTITAAATALLLLAAAGTAEAAQCEPELLRGIWVGHATTEVDLYCLIDVDAKGLVLQSSCFAPKSLRPVATLSGRLQLSEDCAVRARFTLTLDRTSTPAVFRGRLVPGRSTMNGDFVVLGQSEDYRFVRQLD
jgi:hypothetical protein